MMNEWPRLEQTINIGIEKRMISFLTEEIRESFMGRYHLGLEEQNGLVDLELLIVREDGEASLKQAAVLQRGQSSGCLVLQIPCVLKLVEHNIERGPQCYSGCSTRQSILEER